MCHTAILIAVTTIATSLDLPANDETIPPKSTTVKAPSNARQEKTQPNNAKPRATNYPPRMSGATEEVYKKVGNVELKIYIFTPEKHEANESRPAIVFFFGGGWKSGTPKQFEQQCRYLAARGMVAMTADYRVSTRHQTKAVACVSDGKSAIRWIRKHAARLGINPDRVMAGGGSAGGHVAACTATIRGFEEESEDHSVSSAPNGLALFNPALVLSNVDGEPEFPKMRLEELGERLGVQPEKLSPLHQLNPGLPPTIIFHGKADQTVAYRTAEIFANKAKENGDLVKLLGYDEQGHGFFNFGREDNKSYIATMTDLDRFLVDHGYLQGPTPDSIEITEPARD